MTMSYLQRGKDDSVAAVEEVYIVSPTMCEVTCAVVTGTWFLKN